ncbi:hypothetical protein HDU81_007182 [Chytriomyces hyalinus]|nr:hypothetical protein HDU81_007182 [Chytriomyces hyalinus]
MMAAEVDEVEVKVAKDILDASPKKQLASIQKTMSLETGELDASDGGVSSAGASDEEGLLLRLEAGKKTSELSFVMVRLASDIISEPADSEHSGQLVPEVPRGGLDADALAAAFDKIADDAVAPTGDNEGLAAVRVAENKVEMVLDVPVVVRVRDGNEPDETRRDEVELAAEEVNHPENKFDQSALHDEQSDGSETHEVEPDEYEVDEYEHDEGEHDEEERDEGELDEEELDEDELGEGELDEDEFDEDALDEDEMPASSDEIYDSSEFIEGDYENTLRKRHTQPSNDSMSDDPPSDELILPEPSNILEEVWMSVFTPGVNSRVVMVMDVCFYALFFVFFGMLVITSGNFHVIFLILITACLFISVKWFLAELRRVEADSAKNASKDLTADSGDAGRLLGHGDDRQNDQQETSVVEAVREKKEN